MKNRIVIAMVLFFSLHAFSQTENDNAEAENQLEALAETNENEVEDDSYLQVLQKFRKHPLNLNLADEEDLKELLLLNEVQVRNFFLYRKLFGNLLDVYEL